MKKSKKILMIGATTGGGVATVGNNVTELIKNSDKFIVKIVDKNSLDKFNKYLRYLRYYIIAYRKIQKFKPDFVYLQVAESAYIYQSIILLIAKIINKKIVTIAHLHCKPEPEKLKIRFVQFSQRFIDKMIVINKVALTYFIENIFWSNHILYLPNFVESKPLDKYFKNLTIRKHILYIGRMHKEKGIYEILEIAKHFSKENFILIGDFSDEIEENKFMTLSKRIHNVKWLGPIYNENKFEKISYSKLLLFPTCWRGEIFPLTMLECGLLGVPSFVTPIGAIPEIIINKENGVFISSNDVTENVTILSHYLNDERALRKLSQNCNDDFNEKYTSENNKEKLINFILE